LGECPQIFLLKIVCQSNLSRIVRIFTRNFLPVFTKNKSACHLERHCTHPDAPLLFNTTMKICQMLSKQLMLVAAFWLAVVAHVSAQTGGIRGTVKTDSGDLLPFATIFIKNTQTGTASNSEGVYELKLSEGKYTVVFQYTGYESVQKEITVNTEMSTLNVVLQPVVIQLRELEVRAGSEDPAYTIMRKAIAMSKVHKLQVDQYDARVYMKGTGRVLNIPMLLEKKLKEEGVEEGKAYLTENITDIHFEQPNRYIQRVISVRSSNVEPQSASPMTYIQASFYDPYIQTIISPLAPNAFAYYRFKYENTFKDQGYEVNKIRVVPISRGDDVWEGYIYIVEDRWCIHSLQLDTEKLGINIRVEQTNAPIQEGVFMPINYKFKIHGSYLGFEGEFNYVAALSNYKVKVNPKFIPEVKLVDEKIEREKAKNIAQNNPQKNKLEEALGSGKELRRKDLKKLIKEAEKEQLKAERKATPKDEVPPSELARNDSFSVDTLARKRGLDEKYWNEIRPIPLADFELKSYQERDSLVKIDSVKKVTGDTLETDKKGKERKGAGKFGIGDILFGDNIKVGKGFLRWVPPFQDINFNTVEGLNANAQLIYRRGYKNGANIRLTGVGRYAFAREVFSGKGAFSYRYKNKWNVVVEGGRFIEQMNSEAPIPFILNTMTTLFFERNWAKLYEKNYGQIRFNSTIARGMELKLQAEYAQRQPLENMSGYRFINFDDRVYTSNVPENVEVSQTAFPRHNAFTVGAHLSYKPFLRYAMRNGRKYLVNENSPTISATYRKGMADVNYDFVSLGWQHTARLGIRGSLGYYIGGGMFLNKQQLYFPDFKHFNGNRIFIQFGSPITGFRLLDYYRFSTADKYLEAHGYLQFRKFLFTQFTALRAFGIKENLFANQLLTPKNVYTEVGYALDGILRLFRVEAVAAFENGKYKEWGIRIGITTTFGIQVTTD
jgi:hypothetical protein